MNSVSAQDKVDILSKIKSNSDKIFFILGPCVIESESHTLKVAEFLKKLSQDLGFNFIFKSSIDKANRTSINSFRGVGFEQGLNILAKVKSQLDLPVITDVHESWQVEPISQVADVIQIPAFLSRQTDLLLAAGKTDKIINIKKGQFVAPENMGTTIEKVRAGGTEKIWLCERGYTFGYNNLVVDYRNFPIMKTFNRPIVFDATHSVQRPSGQGCSSGGDRRFVPALAASAIAQGIAGLFMEVHNNPDKALCDGPNSIPLSSLKDLLSYLIDLDSWIKNRTIPEIR